MNKDESSLEKITGNIASTSIMTLISAYSGLPISALLPGLTDSIASNRHKARVQNTLDSINEELEKHKDLLQSLSDAQYKLLNETVLTIFQTVDENKIKYLRNAVINSINRKDISHSDSYVLSRVIRDISAEEFRYLLTKTGDELTFSSLDGSNNIDPESEEGEVINGLISLGLIIAKGGTMDELGIFIYSPIVEDLINLVRDS